MSDLGKWYVLFLLQILGQCIFMPCALFLVVKCPMLDSLEPLFLISRHVVQSLPLKCGLHGWPVAQQALELQWNLTRRCPSSRFHGAAWSGSAKLDQFRTFCSRWLRSAAARSFAGGVLFFFVWHRASLRSWIIGEIGNWCRKASFPFSYWFPLPGDGEEDCKSEAAGWTGQYRWELSGSFVSRLSSH